MKAALVAIAFLVVPAVAFARGGTLPRPGIAQPTGVDLSQVREVLARKDFKYATGWFINAHSVLCYEGDAGDLSRFLQGLAECENATVSLRFSRELGESRSPFVDKESAPRSCQWRVEHNAWVDADHLTVTVYVGDERIDLEKLALPAWRGGKAGPPVPAALDPAAEEGR
jgi:hypothetical protein